MADDVEQMLSGLEQRLRALQSELDEPDPEPPDVTRAEGLEEFGAELRRLVTRFERLVGGEGLVFRDEVLLDAACDLDGLCALAAALARVDGVGVELRAYGGGHALLELRLARPVALVTELHRTLRLSLSVVEAREGRLTIEVGSFAGRGP